MYKVTRVSDGASVLSVWPAVYLNCPDEYEVHTPDGTPITTIDELLSIPF